MMWAASNCDGSDIVHDFMIAASAVIRTPAIGGLLINE